jgi:transcriptional regulator with XRE-family HTH domain
MERSIETSEGRKESERARIWLEATENLCALMQHEHVSQVELARRLGISQAYVSKMLSGTQNLTLATLADAFHVLGRSLRISYGPPSDSVHVQRVADIRPRSVSQRDSVRRRHRSNP